MVAFLLAPLVAFAAVEAAGLATVNRAIADADRLRSSSSFSDAVAEYDAVSSRSGFPYVVARSRVSAAAVEAQRTSLQWAKSLAAAGQVDQALEMISRVSDPSLLDEARRDAAQIAIDDATHQEAAGRPDLAVKRLDLVVTGVAPSDLAAQAQGLRPAYSLAAAGYLLSAGDARSAVAELDAAIAAGATGASADEARALLPGALLAAGQQALAGNDEGTALVDLQRIVDSFAASSQATTARRLLAAPQPVTGTLVHRDGSPASSVRVRLGSNYRRSGPGFATSAPYYYARTDAQGAFRFTNIPVGAKLTLEILDAGQWTVLETEGADPSSQRPLYDVTVEALTPVDLAFVRLPT